MVDGLSEVRIADSARLDEVHGFVEKFFKGELEIEVIAEQIRCGVGGEGDEEIHVVAVIKGSRVKRGAEHFEQPDMIPAA